MNFEINHKGGKDMLGEATNANVETVSISPSLLSSKKDKSKRGERERTTADVGKVSIWKTIKRSWRNFFRMIALIRTFLWVSFTHETKILSEEELRAGYMLRAKVFGKQLGWINCLEEEIDRVDALGGVTHFGVYSRNKLVAYARMLPGKEEFMLEREFSQMIDLSFLDKTASAEISRLAIDPKKQKTVASLIFRFFLYREMIRWAKREKIDRWYFVVEKNLLKHLQNLFNCQVIGSPYRFEDGIVAYAVSLSISEAYQFISQKGWLYRRIRNWICG